MVDVIYADDGTNVVFVVHDVDGVNDGNRLGLGVTMAILKKLDYYGK